MRALRGEFRVHAPLLTFMPGKEGGVAVFHEETEIGLWVAASRHCYQYMHADGSLGMTAPCDIMDIISVNHELFSSILYGTDRGSA